MVYTLLSMNKDLDRTLLVNLLDAHSSLLHRLYMMHTPHYSVYFDDAHSTLLPSKWISIYMIYTLLPMNKDFDFKYALSW